jgi:hypothetical protein
LAGAGKSKPEASDQDGTLIMVSSGAGCNVNTISCGQSRDGRLSVDSCDQSPRGTGYVSEQFTFNANAGDTVSLNVDWEDVDGYLYLQEPGDEEPIKENDDYFNKRRSRLEHVLERSGTHTIWTTTYSQAISPNASGDYELTLGCDPSSSSAPDLVVNTPQVSPTTLRPGQNLSVTTQARNQGNGPSADTLVQFILAPSASLSASDRVLGTSDVGALSEGGSSPESLSVALNVTPGSYWVGTCVAADVLELDSENNCAVTGPITVEEDDQPIAINPGLNDAWFNPDTNGQGFFINVFPDTRLMLTRRVITSVVWRHCR